MAARDGRAFVSLFFLDLAGLIGCLLYTSSSVLTCINNVGPGLGVVGAVGNFSTLSYLSKGVLSFVMLAGRLEIFPMLMLLVPSMWSRK